MDIYGTLSSQANDRSGNHLIASMCLKDRSLLSTIVDGLESDNNGIVIDCVEVLTEVAKEQPTWVVPYGQSLPKLLNNKNNRARWEAMHCISLIEQWPKS